MACNLFNLILIFIMASPAAITLTGLKDWLNRPEGSLQAAQLQ
jgi:hypothetical protein